MTELPNLDLDTLAHCWTRYRRNLPRTLGTLTVYIEQEAMRRLSHCGHTRLMASFSTPMSILALKPRRLTELARAMSVSKQLCLQSLKPLENLGYIERCPDPNDGRAKILRLSENGWQLVTDALRELTGIEQGFGALLGKRKLERLSRLIKHAYLTSPPQSSNLSVKDIPVVSGMTVALNRDIQGQLMQLTSRAGHKGLQMSFAQVLGAVDLAGSSVSAIATLNGVSPSAISRTAKELEQLGYIKRQTDLRDRRSRKLLFTPFGLTLICDAMEATAMVEAEISRSLPTGGFEELNGLLEQLCEKLKLDESLLKPFDPDTAAALINDTPNTNREPTLSPRLEALLRAAEALDQDPTLTGPKLIQRDRSGQLKLSAEVLTGLSNGDVVATNAE